MSNVAAWPTFMAKLQNRQEVAERTMSFSFDKPAGWTFRAGQFIDITLISPAETDAEGNTRGFSVSSAPYEEAITITTRMRGTAFKRIIGAMPLDTEAKIEGPFGDLRLHNNAARPAVFIAGGIGVTPVRSVVLQATKDKLPHRIFLFYSNRRPEDAPFLGTLQELERQNPNFRFIPTMTEMQKSRREWHGETGYVDHNMLSKYLKGAASSESPSAGPIFYITGPAAMVHGLRTMLTTSGIDEDDIRTEEFAGY
jgi:ferredoxin-NADP reductase